jgi:mannitol/fructose-specific phosphotransferase system IIA component (Ntr-type)
MSLLRILRPESIKLELVTVEDPERLEDPEWSIRYKRGLKEEVLGEIADLFESSGAVSNRNKLLVDLVNREKKSSTALGRGVAIPHVRTKQARGFTAAVLRSTPGIWFDAPDAEAVHIFIAMVAPPHDDQQYLKVYRQIGKAMVEYPEMLDSVMKAGSAEEIRRVLKYYLQ